MQREYRPRLIDDLVGRLLAELPALLIVGPRAVGKTTTAARHARTTVRLDREAEAVAFRADPDAALRGLEEPVLLDEWQVVPAVLGAVKRAVDADSRPGRYLMTGSVTAELDESLWPGTGRVVRLALGGMSMRELTGDLSAPAFLDRLALEGPGAFGPPGDPPDLRGYVEHALVGGFPEAALHLSRAARQLWVESYVDQLLVRDAARMGNGRDPRRLARYFRALALNTAGLADDKTLHDAAGISRSTGLAYDRLLRDLLVVDTLAAWSSNRLKRLVRAPKRLVVDPSLVAGALHLDANDVLRDGDMLGRLLETFVVAQLRAELALCATRPVLYHLRQEQGRHEVDIVAEFAGGRVVAMEVKADSAPGPHAARHLIWLRDALGERFLGGVVLHTGPRSYGLSERIHAAPIATLWG